MDRLSKIGTIPESKEKTEDSFKAFLSMAFKLCESAQKRRFAVQVLPDMAQTEFLIRYAEPVIAQAAGDFFIAIT